MNSAPSLPVGIGIVGCGHWGPNHIRVFQSLPDCRVVALADSDATRLERVRSLVPAARFYAEAGALFTDSAVSAVVIATPTVTHFRLVGDALRAGKHVLCEKPLCLDPAEGRQLVDLAHRHGLVLMVGHVFLFNPGLQKVKELVDAGEVGLIRSLSAIRTNLGPVRADVNAAWDLASHDISVFNWLLGEEPVEVQAMGAAFVRPGIEDIVHISMKYPGNVLASIHCSWLDPKKVRQLTLVGSRRMITWDDLALSNPVAIYEKSVETSREASDFGEFIRLSMLDGDVRLPKVSTDEPLRAQNRDFVRAITTESGSISDGRFALGVVRALAMAQACLQAPVAPNM